MVPRSLVSLLGAVSLTGAVALAQRPPRVPPPPPPPPPQQPAEVTPAPVAEVDGMLRRMRVWLFTPPAGSSAFGVGGAGRRIWALLPSCRPPSPEDQRPPCPIGRLTFEAVGGGSVNASEPEGLTQAPDARRVQGVQVGQDVRRLRIRILGNDRSVRYEAIVDATRLGDLPAPQGSPRGSSFAFDLTQYPAR